MPHRQVIRRADTSLDGRGSGWRRGERWCRLHPFAMTTLVAWFVLAGCQGGGHSNAVAHAPTETGVPWAGPGTRASTAGYRDWDLVKGSHPGVRYESGGKSISADRVMRQLDDYIDRVEWDRQSYPGHTFYIVALFPTVAVLDLQDAASPHRIDWGTRWPMSQELFTCRLESRDPPERLVLDQHGVARVTVDWGELIVDSANGVVLTSTEDEPG